MNDHNLGKLEKKQSAKRQDILSTTYIRFKQTKTLLLKTFSGFSVSVKTYVHCRLFIRTCERSFTYTLCVPLLQHSVKLTKRI